MALADDIKLSSLALRPRLKNALSAQNLEAVADLRVCTRHQLLCLFGVGPKSLALLDALIRLHQLRIHDR